jgi:poly(A) polymerase
MSSITLSPDMAKSQTRQVFAALEAAGGAGCVRFVGGCVRNALMDRPQSDLDLSTQLLPDQVEAALKTAGIKSVPTGKVFGTITAVVDGEPYEITSLREDVETDGRRAVVKFTDDWARDAQRRDFYINALYADGSGEVFDPTGHGLADAAEGRVRFIGEAHLRIREDYLRILRFFRFTAGYASTVDPASLAACADLKSGIDSLSGERISQELIKLMGLAAPQKVVGVMVANGIMDHVLPGSVWGDLTVFDRMVDLSAEAPLRLAALVCAGQILAHEPLEQLQKRLRFSNMLMDKIKSVSELLPRVLTLGDEAHAWRLLIYHHGREAVSDAIWLKAAILGWSLAQALEATARFVTRQSVPSFPLKGADLIHRGVPVGPEVSARLKAIEQAWLDHDFSQSVINEALDQIGASNKK